MEVLAGKGLHDLKSETRNVYDRIRTRTRA